MSATQTKEQLEIAELIVRTLNLESVEPAGIHPDDNLFGSGLGLDSIDALELSLEISKKYGIEIRAEDQEIRNIFTSLRSLTDFIQSKRVT